MDKDLQHTVVWDTGQDSRNVAVMFAVSALFHVAFFILIMVMPASFSSSYRLAPQAISVDLVSLPPGPSAPAAPAAVTPPADTEPEPEPEITPPAPAPAAVPLPAPEPEPVPIAPKPNPQKVVKSLKKRTLKKETVEKTAVQKPTPPTAAKSHTRQISKAIEAMRQKVETQEKTHTAAGAGAGAGAGTGGGAGGSAVLSRIENYRIEAALAVAQNWAFSQQLAGADEQLETRITFRILPDGEITDIKIVQPSGNRYLDESAYRAVRKASPVAPFPEGINRPYIEVGVKATPSGFR
jgi:colicin import membrane protein